MSVPKEVSKLLIKLGVEGICKLCHGTTFYHYKNTATQMMKTQCYGCQGSGFGPYPVSLYHVYWQTICTINDSQCPFWKEEDK